jgi:hypothetical protein
VSLDDLIANAGVLPISEVALLNIVTELEQAKTGPDEWMIDQARYALRAVAAILPPERFNITDLAEIAGIDPECDRDYILAVVEAREEYEGEAPATLVRRFV